MSDDPLPYVAAVVAVGTVAWKLAARHGRKDMPPDKRRHKRRPMPRLHLERTLRR
jgi:hypothetical protein